MSQTSTETSQDDMDKLGMCEQDRKRMRVIHKLRLRRTCRVGGDLWKRAQLKESQTMNHAKKLSGIIAGLLALGLAGAGTALGSIVTVLPGDPNWANPSGENGGGGSSAITATDPHSGNGSLELFGDRTRFIGLGNPYATSSNLGLLSSVTGLTFDWSVAVGSTQGTTPNYSPALRLTIWDNGVRSELIWENAYNGPTPVVQGTWYTSGASDNFWRYVNGSGDSGIYNRTISQWASLGYDANAYVSAVSVGVGSSAGNGYHAFADNVTLDIGGVSTTYNFEAVPEPATIMAGALLLLPFGATTFRKLLGMRTA